MNNNKKNCYHLCLYYTGPVHPRIIEKDFESFYELDKFTMGFKDEEELRKHFNNRIAECQRGLYKYLQALPAFKQNGKILMVKNGVHFKPYYQSTYKTPKQLIETIGIKLYDSKSNELIKKLIGSPTYEGIFEEILEAGTDSNKHYKEVQKYTTRRVNTFDDNLEDFSHLVADVERALGSRYNIETRRLSENDEILYRTMLDSIEEDIEWNKGKKDLPTKYDTLDVVTEMEKMEERIKNNIHVEYDPLYYYKKNGNKPYKDSHYLDGDELYDPTKEVKKHK